MNADIKTVTLEVPVGPTTEAVFTDAFWAAQDVVVNALDNIEARKYVDRKCIAHSRPMLDSGTLGTKVRGAS
jgi:ubiquitin-activating enzyme E1